MSDAHSIISKFWLLKSYFQLQSLLPLITILKKWSRFAFFSMHFQGQCFSPWVFRFLSCKNSLSWWELIPFQLLHCITSRVFHNCFWVSHFGRRILSFEFPISFSQRHILQEQFVLLWFIRNNTLALWCRLF